VTAGIVPALARRLQAGAPSTASTQDGPGL